MTPSSSSPPARPPPPGRRAHPRVALGGGARCRRRTRPRRARRHAHRPADDRVADARRRWTLVAPPGDGLGAHVGATGGRETAPPTRMPSPQAARRGRARAAADPAPRRDGWRSRAAARGAAARRPAPDISIRAVYGLTEALPVAVATGERGAGLPARPHVARPAPARGVGAHRRSPMTRGGGDRRHRARRRGTASRGSRRVGEVRTGDLGALAGDGTLLLAGRAKSMIIRGQANIYPGPRRAAAARTGSTSVSGTAPSSACPTR